jgi:hypothetical protein
MHRKAGRRVILPFQQLIQILRLFSPGIIVSAIAYILVWIFYPEKIEKWGIMINKLAAYFSEKHERRYISKHIEYRINNLKEKFCKESEGIFPYKFKIEWIKVDQIESYLQERDNVLIVKMKNHRNQSKNLAIAVREYVPHALIPTARRYVEPHLMKAIDYVASKEFLAKDTNALTYLSIV